MEWALILGLAIFGSGVVVWSYEEEASLVSLVLGGIGLILMLLA